MKRFDATVFMVLSIIYDTYHIVQRSQAIPAFLTTIEGIEGLVNEHKIPREVATIIYKLMNECEPKEE